MANPSEEVVMPGFRFHPTEEELVEFYLRRKVEGKRFNVELIAFVDLYRFDPWELPGLAVVGEKEWYFYVPRDRKYRNGDRPNRVTTSGYWKATGADRVIKSESHHKAIGLKKTLVFYSGKAPKGLRTRWIMNEYRLPQQPELKQKAEISLCRVYKRAGLERRSCFGRSPPLFDGALDSELGKREEVVAVNLRGKKSKGKKDVSLGNCFGYAVDEDELQKLVRNFTGAAPINKETGSSSSNFESESLSHFPATVLSVSRQYASPATLSDHRSWDWNTVLEASSSSRFVQ